MELTDSSAMWRLTADHCDRTSGPHIPPFHLFTPADCGCTSCPTQGGTSENYSTIRTQVPDPILMNRSSPFQDPLQPALLSNTTRIQHSKPTQMLTKSRAGLMMPSASFLFFFSNFRSFFLVRSSKDVAGDSKTCHVEAVLKGLSLVLCSLATRWPR